MARLRPLLAAEERPVYFVGGTVRDAILGRAIHDIDLLVADGAISLTFRLADALGSPAYVLDAERDIGRILVLNEAMTLDVARFRGSSLEDDLRDRDFTINALALPVDRQTDDIDNIIDQHEGINDLHARRIRIIHERSISDDPVRAMRAARFAVQLGFDMTDETTAAAQAVAPVLLERVSPERIRDELSRLLATETPHEGIAQLDQLGLLTVVLPEVAALDGVDQPLPHHEDVLRHTMSVLRYLVQIESIVDGTAVDAEWSGAVERLIAPNRAELRAHLDSAVDGGMTGRLLIKWGGLLHDIGKKTTQTIDTSGRIRFLGHDEAGAEMAVRRLSAFSFSNEAIRRVHSIVAGHMRPLNLASDGRPPTRRAAYRYFRDLHESGLDVGLLSLADHLATYAGIGDHESWESLLVVIGALFETYFSQYERVVAPPRLLDGRAIMELLGMPPGHEIGRLLRSLEEAQAAGEVATHDEAVAFIRRQYMP